MNPKSSVTCRSGAEEDVILYKRLYETHWQDKDDAHWMYRLVQEVGELASSLADDHKDSIEWELRQIASICMNWMEKRSGE